MSTRTSSSPVSVPLGVLVVALGGALGAGVRALLLELWPTQAATFPWTVFAINVVGSALLASLALIDVVRRTPWLPLFLGTGVLGGFTTMSTAAVETYELRHHLAIAALYLFGTLAAALAAVMLVNRVSSPSARALLEAEEADE